MTVTFYGSVQEHTFGEKSVELGQDLVYDGSISAIIDLLGERFGEEFREFLLGDKTCFFLVNGTMATGGLNTPLHPDDIIEVLPFVDGG